jgi:hypothetical protein
MSTVLKLAEPNSPRPTARAFHAFPSLNESNGGSRTTNPQGNESRNTGLMRALPFLEQQAIFEILSQEGTFNGNAVRSMRPTGSARRGACSVPTRSRRHWWR